MKYLILVIALSFFSLKPLAAKSPQALWQDYQGQRAFSKEDYAKSLEAFARALEVSPSAELYYKQGTAQYRLGDFEGARQSFEASLNTADPSLRQRSYYNLGNALYRLQKLEEAVAAYEEALKISPTDAPSKLNRDFVKKLLEKKPPPQGQQKSESGDQEGKQKGQSQDSESQKSSDSQEESSQKEKSPSQEEAAKQEEQEESASAAKEKPSQAKPEEKKSEQGGKDPEQTKQEASSSQDQKQAEAQKSDLGKQGEPRQGDKKLEELKGSLERQGAAPQESQSKPGKKGLAQAQKSPKAKEAERWLNSIQDRAQEIREGQILNTLRGSRRPEKDW